MNITAFLQFCHLMLYTTIIITNLFSLSYFGWSCFSYPRTESTAYPSSFDFRGTLRAIDNNQEWQEYVQKLLADGYVKPRSGNDAGDHPPITPMRSATQEMLGHDAWKLYQYVCQHFLGTLSPDSKYTRWKLYFLIYLMCILILHK